MREGKGFVAGCGASPVFPAVAAIASGAHESWTATPATKETIMASPEVMTRDMPLERPERGPKTCCSWTIIGQEAPPLVHLSRANTSLKLFDINLSR